MEKMLKQAKIFVAGLTLVFGVSVATATFAQFDDTDSNLQLTQTSAVIGVGQRYTIVSFNGTGLSVRGSNSFVYANVVGGNQVSIYGKKIGNVDLEVCSENLDCKILHVRVQKSKIAAFKLASSKLTVKAGQKVWVNTQNGKDVIALSNSGIVTSYAENGRVLVAGESAGNATVTVCSGNAGCLPIFVKVTGKKPVKTTVPNSPVADVNASLRLTSNSITVQEKKSVDLYANKTTGLTATPENDTVRVAINGNRITFYGTFLGSTSVKVCDETKTCVAVSVKVTKSDLPAANTGPLSVSQSILQLKQGEKSWVFVNNGNGLTAYTSNSYIAKFTIKGSLILISTYSAGKAQVTVCNNTGECDVIFVYVEAKPVVKQAYGSFRSVAMYVGETKNILWNAGMASYYHITSVSNGGVVSANITATTLTITALSEGNSYISLCPAATAFSCGTVGVTVTKAPVVEPKGNVILSDNNIKVANGGQTTITANLSSSLASFSDNPAVRTVVNGNQVTVYGMNLGAANITVCSTNGSCASAYVRVVEPSQL